MSKPEQPVQELREDARLLWALLEATVHAVVIVHESGEIVLVNAAAEVLFGYRCEELVGEGVEILAPERFRHSHRAQRERFTARGMIRPLGIGLDLVACRKDGTEFPVEIGLSRLHTDGGVLISAAISDITERKRAVDALAEAEERFRGAFEEAPIGMAMLTMRLRVLRVNAAMCRLLGRDAEEVVGRSILEFTHAEDVQRSIDWSESRSAGTVITPLVKRYVRPDGAIVEVQVTTALIEPQGSEPYLFSQLQDVTEQRRAERQKSVIADLGRRALQYGDVVVMMGEAVRMVREVLATTSCIITRCSAAGEVRLIAADGDALSFTIGPGHLSQTAYTVQVGTPVLSNDLLGETRFSVAASVLEHGLRRGLSVVVPERSGARHVILAQGPAGLRPFSLDDARFLEAVAHVIAGALDRAASEDELRRRALEDPLTGLANRALLASRLDAELRHARRLGDRVCVLVFDLDRFKAVNDTLGHSAGDALLRQIAARLTGCVREEDLVARPGGDEFTVVCTRTATDRAITEVAERLVDAVIEPFELDGHEVFVTASVGVSVSEHGGGTAEELLRDADAAMYHAKERGGSRFEVFDVALRHQLIRRMAIEGDLRHAVERDQFELHYQPLIDLIDERVVGFEALLRWRHPEHGLIAPDRFIQIAEETRLIVPIGSWVLRAVCGQLAQWPEQIRVSANLSALQITPAIVPEVERLLSHHRVAPDRLVLEITESLVLDPAIKPVVSSLRALGVRLALDDFGSGYSSLGGLQRFPLDLLKLDRTLIDSLSEGGGTAIVRAAVEVGHALGVDVIAEGIETQTQLGMLRELRCPLGQGFLFAKPLPLADARQLVD